MKVTIDTGVAPTATHGPGFVVKNGKTPSTSAILFSITTPLYEGDEAFLAQATPATTALWQKVMVGIRQENATHAPVDFDTNIATTITAHGRAILIQELETIVGLQTDKPLKRALHPYGGINMIRSSFEAYGREMDPQFEYLFTDLRKTHNRARV